jgi:prepilin-type N-terminal cleavage/methylation domain-containing protein
MFKEKGITLVEVLVAVFIIAVFSTILVADFPKIRKRFALSRAAYQLSQDLRRAEDMGLSGVKIVNEFGDTVDAFGYGVYISLDYRIDVNIPANQQYTIYADRGADTPQTYDLTNTQCSQLDMENDNQKDCIIQTANMSQANLGIVIKAINNINNSWTTINFSPPNPDVVITNLGFGNVGVDIVLGLNSDPSITKTIHANISGMIEVK